VTRRILLPLVILGAIAMAEPLAAQCSMCKTLLEGSAEGRQVARGLNHGILLMLAAPYLIFGCFAAVLFRRRILGALTRRWAKRAAPGAAQGV
jgi:ABC-type phosphate transport system permease subunit